MWDIQEMKEKGIRFGKALQMTNILRDLAKDLRIGRCYLPRQELERLGLVPTDLLNPAALPRLRPLITELLALALEHFEVGWAYTLTIPPAEWRMRLACAWPLLIGLRTLGLLIESPNLLDPGQPIKIPRSMVYAILIRSLVLVWSKRLLASEAQRLRARIRA
jgi:farnesyl-diphosphate farnesyltransferase